MKRQFFNLRKAHYKCFSLIAVVFLLSNTNESQAQQSNDNLIKAYLKSADSLPVIGAMIIDQNTDLSTVSDADGYFEINLSAQPLQLIVQDLNGQKDTLKVNYTKDVQTIYLGKTHVLIDETLIVKKGKSSTVNLLGTHKMENIGSKELMKAACCNLSESFETTPSVDVGFTDAISGYKQISMLGLAGAYTSFTRENIPDIRGLASVTGLTFTPGTWVESMQLSKGTGSVVNGFESIAGQINVEWQKPFEEETPQWIMNAYQSSQGRSEGNLIWNKKINSRLSTSIFAHGRSDWYKNDENKDGFLDAPLGKTAILANKWFYFDDSGWEFQAGAKVVYMDQLGGQNGVKRDSEFNKDLWVYENDIKRLETWAKIGKINLNKPWQSGGLQLSYTHHEQSSKYHNKHYQPKQDNLYANFIYQSHINNTNHPIKFGASFIGDLNQETFNTAVMSRKEYVPGVFAEYGYNFLTKFNAVVGARVDYNNLYGAFFTPRLHLRYAPIDQTAIRLSIGKAQRTPNIIADNLGYLANGRLLLFENGAGLEQYYNSVKPEVAWNFGLSLTHKFELNYRDGSLSADYFYTDFTKQTVMDLEVPGQISFYDLEGSSYANSLHLQLDYELFRNFDMRLAYRYYDVKTYYNSVKELLEKPLIAKHRLFANVGYELKKGWKLDYTVQWIGPKRLPAYYDIASSSSISSNYSKSYVTMNAQINKSFFENQFELYLGVENITNEMQHPVILNAQDIQSNYFDASTIWGSAMGRNLYLGFRYKL